MFNESFDLKNLTISGWDKNGQEKLLIVKIVKET